MNENNTKETMVKGFRNGEIVPDRCGEFWDEKERACLRQCFQQGIGISEIALFLQRSEMGVIQQLMCLNLITPSGKQRYRKRKEDRCLCAKCNLRDSCTHYYPCPKNQED